jgi:hypothetical protein
MQGPELPVLDESEVLGLVEQLAETWTRLVRLGLYAIPKPPWGALINAITQLTKPVPNLSEFTLTVCKRWEAHELGKHLVGHALHPSLLGIADASLPIDQSVLDQARSAMIVSAQITAEQGVEPVGNAVRKARSHASKVS